MGKGEQKGVGMSKAPLSISELRTKWRKEETFYQVREVGTGVQIFVKDVLKSPDVFALKVGLNSTKLENRKNEFLEEKKSLISLHLPVIYESMDMEWLDGTEENRGLLCFQPTLVMLLLMRSTTLK